MTELTLLLPVPGMRLKVRILVALPGILTARLVLGRRGLLQGLSLASLERVVVRLDLRVWRMLTAPLPSRGFAWREVAWAAFQSPMASSRRSGSSPVLLVSRFWSGFFHPLLGAPLLGRLSVVPAAGLTAVSLAFWRSSVRWRVATRVLMVAGFPLLRAWRSAPSHIPWPFLDWVRFCLDVRF